MVTMVQNRYIEDIGGGRTVEHRISSRLFSALENFPGLLSGFAEQRVEVLRFERAGKALCVNGLVQLTERADPIYTGALIYPAALAKRFPKRWLIAGGGDGAAAREILSFWRTEKVHLVDISRMVVEATQQYIPSFWAKCQHDSRLRITFADVFGYLRDTGEKFDIIVSDLVDPDDEECGVSGSCANHIYSREGFLRFADHLEPDGIFVMQAQELSECRWKNHAQLRRILEKIFPAVYSYRVWIPCFGYWLGFLIASKSERWNPLENQEPQWVERALAEQYRGAFATRYFSTVAYHELFRLPPAVLGWMP